MTAIDARRADAIRAIVKAERALPYVEGFDFREQITGPVADALFQQGEVVTKTLADGTKLSFAYSSKIARDFVLADEDPPSHVWEPQTTRMLSMLTDQAKHVLIGGAYFGDHAVPLARTLDGVVHCFELHDGNAAMLQKNAEQNGLKNVVINQLGLWSKSGLPISLDGGQDSHASSHINDAGEGRTLTIDDYVSAKGIKLDLIMLDIEGAEIEALKGAERVLRDDGPALIYEVHRSYVDWSNGLHNTDLMRYLSDFGYSSFALRDFNTNHSMAGREIELIPPDQVYLEGPPHGFNMVAVKDPAIFERGGVRVVTGVSPKLLHHRNQKLHGPLR